MLIRIKTVLADTVTGYTYAAICRHYRSADCQVPVPFLSPITQPSTLPKEQQSLTRPSCFRIVALHSPCFTLFQVIVLHNSLSLIITVSLAMAIIVSILNFPCHVCRFFLLLIPANFVFPTFIFIPYSLIPSFNYYFNYNLQCVIAIQYYSEIHDKKRVGKTADFRSLRTDRTHYRL